MRIKKVIRLGRGKIDLWRIGEVTILADTVQALTGAFFSDNDAGFGAVGQGIGQ